VSLPVLVVSLGMLAFCLVVVGFQLKTVTLFCKLLNTLTSGLIQAVRKKQLGSMWLCAGISPLLYGLRTWSKCQKTQHVL